MARRRTRRTPPAGTAHRGGEITRRSILRSERALPDSVRFSTVELHEPPKAAVLGLARMRARSTGRRSLIADGPRRRGRSRGDRLARPRPRWSHWRDLHGVQPRIMAEEFVECEEMLKAHPEYLAALAKRGITDPELLMVDPWSAGGELGTDAPHVAGADLGSLRARRQRLRPAGRGPDRDRRPSSQ